MVVDYILDRKYFESQGDDEWYDDYEFYRYALNFRVADGITSAMDGGTEENVKRELCRYIDDQGYNPDIKDYINSVTWLISEG